MGEENTDRKYLWILAREPRMKLDLYWDLIESARAKGFDVDRLENHALIVD